MAQPHIDPALGGDYPSIIQQCYNARRDLPRALGEWMATGAKMHLARDFLHRMAVAARVMKGFTPEQMAQVRFYACLKGGAP